MTQEQVFYCYGKYFSDDNFYYKPTHIANEKGDHKMYCSKLKFDHEHSEENNREPFNYDPEEMHEISEEEYNRGYDYIKNRHQRIDSLFEENYEIILKYCDRYNGINSPSVLTTITLRQRDLNMSCILGDSEKIYWGHNYYDSAGYYRLIEICVIDYSNNNDNKLYGERYDITISKHGSYDDNKYMSKFHEANVRIQNNINFVIADFNKSDNYERTGFQLTKEDYETLKSIAIKASTKNTFDIK